MEILDGTSTEGPILLGFTRAEFDELCTAMFDCGSRTADHDLGGAILRFRATFVGAEAAP